MTSAAIEREIRQLTGLIEREIRRLSPRQKRELVAWQMAKCGGDIAVSPFLPAAIRRMPLGVRLELAHDPIRDAAWEERERRRVARDHVYFVDGYGSVQPPTGPRIPFTLWEGGSFSPTPDGWDSPGQRVVLEEIREHLRQVWLKARQLGMTWLVLHDAFHLLAFDQEHPNARVLALSRIGGDASKLILRVRKLREHMPPFLRPAEAQDTRRSLTRFGVAGRGEMISLAGTEDAARSETATLLIIDEAGFIKNKGFRGTWRAAQSTLGATGRGIVLSTGNGPADVPGDGQGFAQLVTRAMAGDVDPDDESGQRLHFVFLPASTDPNRRSLDWRKRERRNYLADEDFASEHPETPEEALLGMPGTKVYPLAGIAAAERLGAALDRLRLGGAGGERFDFEEMPPPAPPTRGLSHAIDWGEQTHGLIIWPLEGGGVYVPGDEAVHSHREPTELVQPMLDATLHLKQRLVDARYDAAGVQSMRSYIATLREDLPAVKSVKIPFGDYKAETVAHLRSLFRRTATLLQIRDLLAAGDIKGARRLAEAPLEEGGLGFDDEESAAIDVDSPPALVGVIAISPRNPVLLRQLRGLEFEDDDSGKVEKGDDHGPDALVAGDAPIARRSRKRTAAGGS